MKYLFCCIQLVILPLTFAGEVNLEWDPNPTEDLVQSYWIYEKTGGNLELLAQTTESSLTLTNLAPGDYCFVVTALNQGGESDPSNEVCVTVPEDNPPGDTTAPESRVRILPGISLPRFLVSWWGRDNTGGEGIDFYDIYVSRDGGDFEIWQSATRDTSALFTGMQGVRYDFFSVASDRAGNRQPLPTGPNATTQITDLDLTPPTSQVEPLPPNSFPSFRVKWNGSDQENGSGIALYDIYVSVNGRPFEIWLSSTMDNDALFSGIPNQAYAFYSVATDWLGNREVTLPVAQAQTRVLDIDLTPPSSKVESLPQEVYHRFIVNWSGQDQPGGVGVALYDIYVSENGGPYEIWLFSTTDTQAAFVGEQQTAYDFYSIATDWNGNREPFPAGPDATTRTRALDLVPPRSQVEALPSISPASFQVHWSGMDPHGGAGVALYDIYVSEDFGPFELWQFSTMETNAVYEGEAGHRYGFYSVATDWYGNREAFPNGPQAETEVLGTQNRPPILVEPNLLSAKVHEPFFMTNMVQDPDLPWQNHTFALLSGQEHGASIDPDSGVLSWTPQPDRAALETVFTVQATDNGVPSLTATQQVRVSVDHFTEVQLGTNVFPMQPGVLMPIRLYTSRPVLYVILTLDIPPDQLSGINLSTVPGVVCQSTFNQNTEERWTLTMGLCSGHAHYQNLNLGYFLLMNPDGLPKDVHIRVAGLAALGMDGRPMNDVMGGDGRIMILDQEPVLEWVDSDQGHDPHLVLYGLVGDSYQLQVWAQAGSVNVWAPMQNYTLEQPILDLGVPNFPDPFNQLYRAILLP